MRYHNKDFTLTLPHNKKITDIKWFAVYDISTQVCFYQTKPTTTYSKYPCIIKRIISIN